MIYAAAIILWGALAVVGAGALAIVVGSPFALALAVGAAGATYLFQIVEASRQPGGDFMPSTVDQFVQLILWGVVLALFTLSIIWSLTSYYWS